MHWYDTVYEICKRYKGYSSAEALFGPSGIVTNGCEQQNKTFGYVDNRSGREVRLYGIVNRHTPGADADNLINHIIDELLPFDRTTDHILNNDPSDRDIYCLLEDALRKVYEADISESVANTRLYRESGLLGSLESSESRYIKNGITRIPNQNCAVSTSGANLRKPATLKPSTETLREKLSLMEFLHFYRDIIERVDRAAIEDEERRKKNAATKEINSSDLPADEFDTVIPQEVQLQWFDQLSNEQYAQITNQLPNEQCVQNLNQITNEQQVQNSDQFSNEQCNQHADQVFNEPYAQGFNQLLNQQCDQYPNQFADQECAQYSNQFNQQCVQYPYQLSDQQCVQNSDQIPSQQCEFLNQQFVYNPNQGQISEYPDQFFIEQSTQFDTQQCEQYPCQYRAENPFLGPPAQGNYMYGPPQGIYTHPPLPQGNNYTYGPFPESSYIHEPPLLFPQGNYMRGPPPPPPQGNYMHGPSPPPPQSNFLNGLPPPPPQSNFMNGPLPPSQQANFMYGLPPPLPQGDYTHEPPPQPPQVFMYRPLPPLPQSDYMHGPPPPPPQANFMYGPPPPPAQANFMYRLPSPLPQGDYTHGPPLPPSQANYISGPPSQGNCMRESPAQSNYRQEPPLSPRIRRGLGNRRYATHGTYLPTISEVAESNTNGSEHTAEHGGETYCNGTAFSATAPSTSQQPSTTSVEVAHSNDNNRFLHEAERPAFNQRHVENDACMESGEVASARSGEMIDTMYSSIYGDSIPSHTSVAIVFIYGDKMFIGSIGDSRIILLRQKCHYLDALYLNDPPLTWYPVTSTKNSRSSKGQYILFEKPIVRGGFLVDDSSIFLLMFNDGVTTNMLNLDNYHRTSYEINRKSAEMVIRVLEKYPTGDVAHKFVAHIKHSFSRKYKSDTNTNGITREGMSFLFADLRGLIPKHPSYNQLMRAYPPKLDIFEPNIRLHSRTTRNNNSLSMNYTQDMLQGVHDRGENERQEEMKNASIANDDNTWVFIRTDSNGTGYFN